MSHRAESAAHPSPRPVRRVSVVGCSGSGKTTVARRIAQALDVPHLELDALHWGPGWTAATADELRGRVAAVTSGDAWVVDGNYHSKIGTLVWERADTVVWLDPPRWRVMARSLRRTLRRILTREELWSGNRESWDALKVWRGEESILWWAWTTHPRARERYGAAMGDPAHGHLAFHRVRTRREVERLICSLRQDRHLA